MNAGPALVLLAAALPVLCGDWNPRLSAQYLDSRQKAWFEWRAAAVPGGPCVSCHTGLTYLQARPALRQVLGESKPTSYETGLLNGLKARLEKQEPGGMFPTFVKEPLASQAAAVEAILAAVLLASEPESIKALDRMWSLQVKEGKAKGAWVWFSLGLSPWECSESTFYGATLAAQALAAAPAEYSNRPDVGEHAAVLFAYLRREFVAQPLHNRLTLLWTAGNRHRADLEPMRQLAIEEVWRKQRPDGSWSIDSLGPWTSHARVSEGSQADSYATALAVLALQQTGTTRSDPRLNRALTWLRAHQDPESGSWAADSMNKTYPPASNQTQFMRDAATAYAVLALLDTRNSLRGVDPR